MKILFIHNHYRTSAPSGEDLVAENERVLLQENGVEVISYEKFNDEIDESTLIKKLRLGLDYAWSRHTYAGLVQLIKREHPDIAHVHSIHPQISPSAYAACQDMGMPVVHTLHNYRYICPGALLQKNDKSCEKCVGKLPFNALRYCCYRGSFTATGALVWMIVYNRWRGTFTKQVNRYIALTEFAASRLATGGLPANRIEVKPNFLPIIPTVRQQRQNYAVYVGRLTEEKGVKTLLRAWSSVTGLPLKIIGDGALRTELEQYAQQSGVNVEFMGAKSKNEVYSIIGSAFLQVVPSECYEGFPMVILEAYACGTPVVASRIGSLAEIVQDGETGLHFETGNPADLAYKIKELATRPDIASRLGTKAREIFIEQYTAKHNFKRLMEIYQHAREDFEIRKRS